MCGLSQDEIHINPIAISSFKVIEINRKLLRYVSQNKCATVCQKRASFLVVVLVIVMRHSLFLVVYVLVSET